MYMNPQPGETAAISAKVAQFLATTQMETPFVVMDLDRLEAKYHEVVQALGGLDVYYAVKANPHPDVVGRLARLGASFDVASPREIDLCLQAGAPASALSYGSTLKKESAIAYAHAQGIDLFALDAWDELHKLARSAPGARVFCRLLVDSAGAQWPLSRKFGCDEATAEALLVEARRLGLRPYGLSFHVGSQMLDVTQWEAGIARARRVWDRLAARGIALELLNVGGGFPSRNGPEVPGLAVYGGALEDALRKHFGNRRSDLRAIAEVGRGLVADAGVLETEVVLVSRKSADAQRRWVYLDVGLFHGLAETIDEAVRYPIRTPHDGGPTGSVVIAGPTCDSFDIMYDQAGYELPLALATGERIQFLNTGAYTFSYSAVNFNGFPPLGAVCV